MRFIALNREASGGRCAQPTTLLAGAALLLLPLVFSVRLGPDPTSIKAPVAWLAAAALLFIWGLRGVAGSALSCLVRPPGVFLLGWLAWSVLSLAWSPSAGMGAERLFRIIPSLAFFAAAAAAGERGRRVILAAVAAGGALVAAYGLAQLVGVDPVSWAREGIPFATMGNKNLVAEYLELALPCALVLGLSSRERWSSPWRWLWMLAAGIVLAALVAGRSRGAWVGTTAGLLVAAVFARRAGLLPGRRLLPAALALLAAAGIAALAGLTPYGRATLGYAASIADPGQSSNRFRILAWEDSLSMWRKYPASGVGAGGFQALWPAYATPEFMRMAVENEAKVEHPHNEYLNALAEGGPVAAAGLVGFFAACVTCIWRRLRTGAEPAVLIGAAWGVAAIGVNAAFSFPLSVAPTAAALAALAGAACVGEPVEPVRGRRWPGVVGGAAALVALLFVARPVAADSAMWRAGRSLDPEARIYWLQRARRLAPWRPETSFMIARTAEEAGNLELAAMAYERCRRLEPYGYEALTNLALVYERLGKRQEAEEAFDAAVAANPYAAPTLAAYGRFLAAREEFTRAAELLARAAELDPSPEHLYLLGLVLEASGRRNEAAETYAQALGKAGESLSPQMRQLEAAVRARLAALEGGVGTLGR